MLTGRARRAVLAANVVAALVTLGFSTVVLVDPAVALPPGVDAGAGAVFYGRACALRSIALAAVLLVVIARSRSLPAPLLVVTGFTQLSDAVLHLSHGAPLPATCALVLAALPFTAVGVARGIRHDVRGVDVGA